MLQQIATVIFSLIVANLLYYSHGLAATVDNSFGAYTCNGLAATRPLLLLLFLFFFFFFFLQNNKIQYTDLKLKKLQTRTLKESQTKDSKLKDTDSKYRLMKKKPQKLMKESGISKLKEGCSAMGLGARG